MPTVPEDRREVYTRLLEGSGSIMSSGTVATCSLWTGFLLAGALGTSDAARAQVSESRVQELVFRLGDATTRGEARNALLEMGKPVARLLADHVKYYSRVRSTELLDLLGEMGPQAVDALPILLRRFRELPLELWADALRAFGRIAPYDRRGKLFTQELLAYLRALAREEPHADYQELFVVWVQADQGTLYSVGGSTSDLINRVAGDWGPKLGPTLDELGRRKDSGALETLEDYLERGRHQMSMVTWNVGNVKLSVPYRQPGMMRAAEAMVKIDRNHRDSMVAHAVLLRRGDPLVRQQSLEVFGRAGPLGAGAVPFLRDNLFDFPTGVIADSCTALGMIGPDARAAIIALEQLAEHGNIQIAERAKAALQKIRG